MAVGHESSCCASQSMIRAMAHTAIAARTGHQAVHGRGCYHGAVPAVVGVIESGEALLLRGDGSTVSPGTNQSRGGALGAVGRASSACSYASHSGCWIKPGKGQRLWRACVGACWAWERSQERCWERGATRHG